MYHKYKQFKINWIRRFLNKETNDEIWTQIFEDELTKIKNKSQSDISPLRSVINNFKKTNNTSIKEILRNWHEFKNFDTHQFKKGEIVGEWSWNDKISNIYSILENEPETDLKLNCDYKGELKTNISVNKAVLNNNGKILSFKNKEIKLRKSNITRIKTQIINDETYFIGSLPINEEKKEIIYIGKNIPQSKHNNNKSNIPYNILRDNYINTKISAYNKWEDKYINFSEIIK